jgi:hypothetical protein
VKVTNSWTEKVGVFNTPACADIDGDGKDEMLIHRGAGLALLNENGHQWTREIQPEGTAAKVQQPVFLDVDQDGVLEIVVGRQGRLQVLKGEEGSLLREWELPHKTRWGEDSIGGMLTVESRGEQRLLVPTVGGGLYCLNETLEEILWQMSVPPSEHGAFAGDVTGDGVEEMLWAHPVRNVPTGELGVLWLLNADGEVLWRKFTDEVLGDDNHLDYALLLGPTDTRRGVIVLPDGLFVDDKGKQVCDYRDVLHHGQRAAHICNAEGREVILVADRGLWVEEDNWAHHPGSTGVVAVDLEGNVVWERRDVTARSGHNIGDGYAVRGGEMREDLYVAAEIGNWGGKWHGAGEYWAYLLNMRGETVAEVSLQVESGKYMGTMGVGADLDGDGAEEMYVLTNEGLVAQYLLE